MEAAARDAATSLQSDVAHCQLTVQKRLERLAAQGGAQGDPSV